MQTMADELQEKSRAYWIISYVRKGRAQGRLWADVKDLSFADASEVLQEIQETTNFVRPIARYADALMQELISDRVKTQAEPAKIHILSFA